MKGRQAVLASWPLGPGLGVHPAGAQEAVTGVLSPTLAWTLFMTLYSLTV